MPLYRAAGSTLVNLVAADTNTTGFIKDVEGFRVLAASSVAVPLTGTTSETALATITVPAGTMGANGFLIVTSYWSYTNSANNKTIRARFGGTAIAANVVTTTASAPFHLTIGNRNSASSQIIGMGTGLIAATSGALGTSSQNTAGAIDLTLNGTLASAAETITLESYIVQLKYGA